MGTYGVYPSIGGIPAGIGGHFEREKVKYLG
jgi:hypothetical protein